LFYKSEDSFRFLERGHLPSNHILLLHRLVFCSLLVNDESQVLLVEVLLILLGLLFSLLLAVALCVEFSVHECLLHSLALVHLPNDILTFFGTEVRLIVQFFNEVLIFTLRFVFLHLEHNAVLVLLHVVLMTVMLSSSETRLIVDVIVECGLLLLAVIFKGLQILLVTLQSEHHSVVSNRYTAGQTVLDIRFLLANIAQRVVVDREGTLRAKEHWHVGVISRRDCFTVKCFLHKILDVTLRRSYFHTLIFFSFHSLSSAR